VKKVGVDDDIIQKFNDFSMKSVVRSIFEFDFVD